MTDKKEKNKKRLVLLDAHAILHRAYHALPDFTSGKGEPTGGLYGLSLMLLKIIQDLKPDFIVACYDLAGPTYRHEAYQEYKAGRQKTEDNLIAQIERSRDIFESFSIPIYDKKGYEADDLLGTIVEKTKNDKNLEVVIASGDMDTLQLVRGKRIQVYTLKKGIKDTIVYDEKAVLERFGFPPELLPDYKGLRGDPSDNIIGIKGIGDKTATELIKNFGSIEDIYKALKKDRGSFLKAGVKERIIKLLEDNKEEAEFSKMLAVINRNVPVEFALPKQEWTDSIDISKIEKLFFELDFRSLVARARSVLSGRKIIDEKNGSGTSALALAPGPSVNEELLREASIALWLVDSNITNPDLSDILNFAKTDSFPKAHDVIFKELEKRNLKKVFDNIEKPLIPIVSKMEKTGVAINIGYLKKLSTDYHERLKKIETDIYKMAGNEFNINSPKQLSEILFDKMKLQTKGLKKTAGGARSTRESELEKLKEGDPIIEEILKYRALQKLLSTYIDNIPDMVSDDGRLHANFLQAGTTTGRMSSNNPNLQNIPIKSEDGNNIRKAFIAPEGSLLVDFDYSQIELRIAAMLSKDEKLLRIFRSGGDIHAGVASEVFQVPEEKVTKEMRIQAKTINFGILYGMGVNALRANLGSDRATAQKFYDSYFSEFRGLAGYIEEMKANAYRKGYTETFFGRRRYFPDIKSRLPYIRASAERMAVNAPIQGTQADIIKMAMVEIDDYLNKNNLQNKARLILQVHDELIYEIDEKEVANISPEIKRIMESVLAPEKAEGITFKANVATGKSWGEVKNII